MIRARPRGSVRACAAAGLVSLLTTACGPIASLEVALRSEPVDVAFGEQEKQQGPSPASDPRLLPPTSGPGIISAPVRLDVAQPGRADVPAKRPTTGAPLPPPEPCPTAPVREVPDEAAPNTVTGVPEEGVYRFRREGSVKTTGPNGTELQLEKAPARPLSTELVREVKNVDASFEGDELRRATYDVIEATPGVRVTTTYLIDQTALPLGATTQVEPGVKITRIVTERTDLPGDTLAGTGGAYASAGQPGVEVFEPSPPIKILDLPLTTQFKYGSVNEAQQRSRSRDARTGATMQFLHYTQGRVTVDVCGDVVQAWQVGVSVPDEGQQSTFTNPGIRDFAFDGTFTFLPQQGLIIGDSLRLGGLGRPNREWSPEARSPSRLFELSSTALIQSLSPVTR